MPVVERAGQHDNAGARVTLEPEGRVAFEARRGQLHALRRVARALVVESDADDASFLVPAELVPLALDLVHERELRLLNQPALFNERRLEPQLVSVQRYVERGDGD